MSIDPSFRSGDEWIVGRSGQSVDTLAKRVHSELRSLLLQGEFPVWERLAEARLAKRLAVSRTPVREALRQLEQEHLVVADETGGYRPKAPDMAHLTQLYAVRENLEEFAVDLACGVDSDRDLLERLKDRVMQAEARVDTDADFVYEDERFHVTIAAAGGNHALAETLQAINEKIRIVRIHDFELQGRIAESSREHRAIAEAILACDIQRAQSLMHNHISKSASLVAERAGRALARMVEPKDRRQDGAGARTGRS